ncbi:MAG: HAMP domain-containing histidine kinase [Verrucomicrobiaceae bacterium]|nr:HAMP domain-containing histidine kinase [Verrucomicrobiaceae bacterium]
MIGRRSTVLFLVLVVLPLVLLAWLGTYLMSDAAKRTDASMQAILAERLSSADYQLVHDLRQLTDEFDQAGLRAASGLLAAQEMARHPWVARSWVVEADGSLDEFPGPKAYESLVAVVPKDRSADIQHVITKLAAQASEQESYSTAGGPPFQRVSGSSLIITSDRTLSTWQTYLKLPGYHIQEPAGLSRSQEWPSGWHVGDSTFIYWLRARDGTLICALMNAQRLMESLFMRLPHPGLEVPPGRMLLATFKGIPLHQWGKRLPGAEEEPEAHRACSEPLSQWELAYTPAHEEFPKPYLFPIALGIGSGILLVLAVGWLYFRESARELSTAQQRVTFVNQISHELKTPLTNIRLYTEMAAHRAEAQGDTAMKRQLAVVENETSRLDRLIQNVLSLARHQRDKLTISPKPVVLDDIVTHAVEFWKPSFDAKGFQIDVELAGPPMIQADPDAISQILGNLLSNVEKYAAAGRYVALRTDVAEGKARLIVEDRGPGIPSSKRRAVFEPFERLRSDLNEGVSGTGIGLTISRELAQLHGGRLAVCTQYRDGSRFILTLPLPPTP